MRRSAAVVATLVAMCVAGMAPASAVSIGPDGYGGGTSLFDLSGSLVGPIGEDDPWSATLSIVGHSGCEMYGATDTSCFIDPELVVGRRYDAVLSESGGGYWWCSIYDEDGCTWEKPYSSSTEYVFTYTGQTQTLNPYYAPVAVAIKKRKAVNPHRWILTCTANRAGRGYANASIRVQWRDPKHPHWHTLTTWKTNSAGKASGWVRWTGARGAVRCASDSDWHSRSGASRAVKMWTR